MLVQCPKCSTTYKVSDEVIKGSAPAFRCSRCKHTFELEADTQLIPGQQQEPTQQAVETGPEAELTFAFPVPPAPLTPPGHVGAEIKSENPTAADDNLVNSASQEMGVLKARQNHEDLPVVETETNTLPVKAKQPKGKKDFAIAEAVHTDEPQGQESDSVRNILPMASYVDQRASIFPYMTLFGLLAIGFGLVAVMSQAHPRASAAIIRNIPIVGPMLLKNIHLKERNTNPFATVRLSRHPRQSGGFSRNWCGVESKSGGHSRGSNNWKSLQRHREGAGTTNDLAG